MTLSIIKTPDILYNIGFYLDYPSTIIVARRLNKTINFDYHEYIQNNIDLRSRKFETDRVLIMMVLSNPSQKRLLQALFHAHQEGRDTDFGLLGSRAELAFVDQEALTQALGQYRPALPHAVNLVNNTLAISSTPNLTPNLQKLIEHITINISLAAWPLEHISQLKTVLEQVTPSVKTTVILNILRRLLHRPEQTARWHLLEKLEPLMNNFLKAQAFQLCLTYGHIETAQQIITDPRFLEVQDECLSALALFLAVNNNLPLFELFLDLFHPQDPRLITPTIYFLLEDSIKRGYFEYLKEILVKRDLILSPKTLHIVHAYLKADELNDNISKSWIYELLQKEMIAPDFSTKIWIPYIFHRCGLRSIKIFFPFLLKMETAVVLINHLCEPDVPPSWLGKLKLLTNKLATFLYQNHPIVYWGLKICLFIPITIYSCAHWLVSQFLAWYSNRN